MMGMPIVVGAGPVPDDHWVEMETEYGFRPLPSNLAAHRFVHDEPGSAWGIATSTLSRAGFIGLGLWLAGLPPKYVLGGSLVSSAVVELSVLATAASAAKR